MRRCDAIDLSDPVSDHPLNRGLVSWWLPLPHLKGSNTLFDLVKTGRNHGTLTNGPTWTAGPNWFGAVQFDGTNDYVSFGTGPSLSGTGDLTISLLLKTTTTAASTLLCQRDTGGFNGGYWLWVNFGTTGKIAWNIYNTAFQWGADWNGLISSASVNDGNWHHVAVTRNGTAGVVYVDGVSSGTATGTVRSLSGALQSYAGRNLRDVPPNDFPYSGIQSDIRIYPTRALSASEVASLYEQSQRGYPDLLRRLPTSRTFVSAGGAPTGNRRRRVLLLGRN